MIIFVIIFKNYIPYEQYHQLSTIAQTITDSYWCIQSMLPPIHLLQPTKRTITGAKVKKIIEAC